MQLEINENPLSDDGGKNEFEKKEMSKNYIEAVPSLPTYHLEDIEITRVLKYLFEPDYFNPKKKVIEYSMGFSHLIENDINSFDFSCLPLAPDTMPALNLVDLFVNCAFDIEFTENQLSIWGIMSVYFENSIASVHNMLEGLDRSLSEEIVPHVHIMCDNGDVLTIDHLFCNYYEDKLIESYKYAKKEK